MQTSLATARPNKPHWLAPAGKTWTPSVVVYFDTETTEIPEDGYLDNIMRCWDARTRLRHGVAPQHWRVRNEAGEEPAQIAKVCEYAAMIEGEAWVFAHNLGFDLAVTSLPFILAEHKWNIDAFHLGDESCWWVFRKDGAKLILTDSWSWVRCDLATAGREVGRRKLPLPSGDDNLAVWHKRCKRDVHLLDGVMTTIMDWWDQNDVGRFGLTGAGCGWSAMRSRLPKKRLLVGPDGERTAFERTAIHGGRKEVYQVGEVKDTWCADYDFVACYPTTVAGFRLPEVPKQRFDRVPESLALHVNPWQDVICEATITTDRPCVPVKVGDEVWWPTGTFRTVLTGPELRYAATVAEKVVLGAGYSYKMGTALADWAAWCLKLQFAHVAEAPLIVSRMAKGWGRSVIGRFASRTSQIVSQRPSQHLNWHLETGHNLETGATIEVLSMGGTELTIEKNVDSADCAPAVLAFVEGYSRVALARMLDSRDPSRLLQCNTDGWWERKAVRAATYELPNVPDGYTVVRKALERKLVVLGPNHVQTPTERRYAGIPRKATENGDGSFAWHDWPGLRWQLEHSENGTYRRPLKDAVLADHYVRRWVLDSGETIPATTDVAPDGSTFLLPFSQTRRRIRSDRLAKVQVPTLQKLRDEVPAILQPEDPGFPVLPGRERLRPAGLVKRKALRTPKGVMSTP